MIAPIAAKWKHMALQKHGLSDPLRAATAWARYRAMMRWMLLAAVAAVVAALAWLYYDGGLLSIHMIIATAAGVGFSVLLATGLMLLSFLSSGSGHDEDVAHLDGDER